MNVDTMRVSIRVHADLDRETNGWGGETTDLFRLAPQLFGRNKSLIAYPLPSTRLSAVIVSARSDCSIRRFAGCSNC